MPGSRDIQSRLPGKPAHYQHDPIHTIKTSVSGLQLARLGQEIGGSDPAASTSEVYGDPQVHPQPEDYWGHVNPFGPRACYDEGKRCAETLFFDYHHKHHVNIKIARIFNTYGPCMQEDDGRVVSNFIVQALQGRPLTVYGNGSQTRSFCYVTDLVEGLVALMESSASVVGPINLGNPAEFTISQLAKMVLEGTGSASAIERRPLPPDDPKQRRPDITRARELRAEPEGASGRRV